MSELVIYLIHGQLPPLNTGSLTGYESLWVKPRPQASLMHTFIIRPQHNPAESFVHLKNLWKYQKFPTFCVQYTKPRIWWILLLKNNFRLETNIFLHTVWKNTVNLLNLRQLVVAIQFRVNIFSFYKQDYKNCKNKFRFLLLKAGHVRHLAIISRP